MAAGFAAALFLLEPFLARFGNASAASQMAIRFVPNGLHTPPLLGLALFYPLLAVLALQLLFGDRSPRALWLCLLWIALLACSEIFFVDDLYSGNSSASTPR